MTHIVASNSAGHGYKIRRAESTLPGQVYILKSDYEEIILLRTVRDLQTFGNNNEALLRETVPFVVLVDPQAGNVGSHGEIVWLSHITPLIETKSVNLTIERDSDGY